MEAAAQRERGSGREQLVLETYEDEKFEDVPVDLRERPDGRLQLSGSLAFAFFVSKVVNPLPRDELRRAYETCEAFARYQ